jgi:hypothetical protein
MRILHIPRPASQPSLHSRHELMYPPCRPLLGWGSSSPRRRPAPRPGRRAPPRRYRSGSAWTATGARWPSWSRTMPSGSARFTTTRVTKICWPRCSSPDPPDFIRSSFNPRSLLSEPQLAGRHDVLIRGELRGSAVSAVFDRCAACTTQDRLATFWLRRAESGAAVQSIRSIENVCPACLHSRRSDLPRGRPLLPRFLSANLAFDLN